MLVWCECVVTDWRVPTLHDDEPFLLSACPGVGFDHPSLGLPLGAGGLWLVFGFFGRPDVNGATYAACESSASSARRYIRLTLRSTFRSRETETTLCTARSAGNGVVAAGEAEARLPSWRPQSDLTADPQRRSLQMVDFLVVRTHFAWRDIFRFPRCGVWWIVKSWNGLCFVRRFNWVCFLRPFSNR